MGTLDDLLIKRRRGGLAPAEARRLEAALRATREYELALLAQDALERDGAPRDGDDARLRELVEAVERRLPAPPRRARSWRLPLRAAVPVLVAGVAAAAVGVSRTDETAPAPPVAAPSSIVAAPPSIPAPAPAEPPALAPSPVPATPSPLEPSGRAPASSALPARPPRAAPLPPVASREPPRAAPPAPRALEPGAAESAQRLFQRASRVRRSDWPAAARLYEELIQRYPSSIEAGVAEVALGKWSLGQGLSGDAIDWFRAYQRRGPGALTAEALFGEARALESIGSLRDAREPWRRLLELYPDSPYASVARQRLERP